MLYNGTGSYVWMKLSGRGGGLLSGSKHLRAKIECRITIVYGYYLWHHFSPTSRTTSDTLQLVLLFNQEYKGIACYKQYQNLSTKVIYPLEKYIIL